MGKDSKGINRGKCTKPGCGCVDFLYNKDNGIKCSNCRHVPIAHAEILKPHDGFLDSASEDEIEPLMDDEETEETYEDVNDDLGQDLSHQPTGSNIDIRGTLRGECTTSGCTCKQFLYIAQESPKCSGCGHAPAKHTAKGANVPARLVNKGREETEFEKDSAPTQLFIKPQNRTFYSRSPLQSSSNTTSVSDLSIADMEEDPIDSPPVIRKPRFRSNRRIPMKREPNPIRYVSSDSSLSGPHPTVHPQRRSPNMIDSSMYNQTAYDQPAVYQHDTLFPAPANHVTQNLAGTYYTTMYYKLGCH